MTPEEKLKQDLERNRLERKVMARNLAEQSNGSTAEMVGALKAVPVNRMFEQIQYLENVLLPKVEANRGRESADFDFYAGIVDTLMWSITILDRHERLLSRYQRQELYCELLAERAVRAEAELKQYEAYEDVLLMGDYMKSRLEAVAKRIESIRSKK